ncbi:hypothetical protein ASY01nite_21960 [Acetobacter syzygii]|nr:hypothetical protein Absy_004_032 [Acetobacter syzygii]GEL57130.1 hypothetical protein ASY01nite_21960 [Acetobacter syzygii]
MRGHKRYRPGFQKRKSLIKGKRLHGNLRPVAVDTDIIARLPCLIILNTYALRRDLVEIEGATHIFYSEATPRF